jgi:DNA-binding beta-propeller fold protein YncE
VPTTSTVFRLNTQLSSAQSAGRATSHFVYVANTGSDNASAYVINPSTGALTRVKGSLFKADTHPFGVVIDSVAKSLPNGPQ